jgi:hypothetical protein
MAPSANEILEHELAKLGADGGAVGGAIGGALGGGAPGAAGGASGGAYGGDEGARFASRFLKEDANEASLELAEPADAALRRVVTILDRLGELHPAESEAPGARAVVRAGWFNMNPAVVEASVEPLGASRTRVVVRGVAKEGFIKQRTGQKAVERVVDSLRDAA